MKSVVTLTSLYTIFFVCVIAIIQSCSGLKCYQCDSKITSSSSKCGLKFVSDHYLIECRSSDVCVEVIMKRNADNLQEHISEKIITIGRNCVSRELIITELSYIDNLQKNGLQIDFKICNTDKCNGS